MLETLSIKTSYRNEMIDITKSIEKLILEKKIISATLIIFVNHTTSGITINENADPDVKKDILEFLNVKIPKNYNFSHLEGNSDAHIKASLIGSSVTIFVNNCSLVLGTWQGVYFCEFDGPRTRNIFIKIIKDTD